MRNLTLSAAMTTMLLASSAASAAIILDQTNTVAAGLPTTAQILSTNDAGYSGSVDIGQLRLDEAGFVRFEYLGKEAGYVNQLNLSLGGTLVFSTAGQSNAFSSSGVLSSEFAVSAGYLPFGLCTSGGLSDTSATGSAGAFGRCAYNDVAASIVDQWYLAGPAGGYRSIGFRAEDSGSWLIFWDDSGARDDDDYDDLIARVHYRVPEPATLGLMGLGLIGLGVASRRRRA